MKKILLLVFALAVSAFAQGNYSYPSSGFIKENNFGDWEEGQGMTDVGHQVGLIPYAGNLIESRNIDNWTWAYTDIPTSASVTSVRIRFRTENQFSYNTLFQFTLNNINHVWGDNNFDYYNAFTSTNQLYSGSITTGSDGYAYFDVTFPSGSALCNAVNSAVQSGQYFFTLGIKITGSYEPDGVWYVSDYSGNGTYSQPAINLQINYSTTTQSYDFANSIEGTTNYGSLKLKNDQTGAINSYSSNTTVPLDPRYTYSITTNELPFVANWNGSGLTEKHQYWIVNTNIDTNIITYDLKPDLKFISSNLPAHFTETSPATITTNIDGIFGGSIQLDDPWYYYSDPYGNWYQTNQFYQYSVPFVIQNGSSSYGGIFTGQSGPLNNWNPPYYSVNFPSNQSISVGGSNHTLYFQNWTATSGSATFEYANSASTPVVFNSANTTIQAM